MKAKLSCIPTEVPTVGTEEVQEKPVSISLQQQEEISPQIAEINTTDVKDTIVGTEVKENRTPLLAVTSQEMAEQECEDLRKMVGVLPSSAMLNISLKVG